MPKQAAHIMIGDTKWCDWSGCIAGMKIMDKIGQRITCGHSSIAAAKRAAALLRPHFRRGAVKVVPNVCPA